MRVRLPSEDKLSYLKLLAETAIVLLVLPLILFAILKDPHHAAEKAWSRGS